MIKPENAQLASQSSHVTGLSACLYLTPVTEFRSTGPRMIAGGSEAHVFAKVYFLVPRLRLGLAAQKKSAQSM